MDRPTLVVQRTFTAIEMQVRTTDWGRSFMAAGIPPAEFPEEIDHGEKETACESDTLQLSLF